ncbi:MAG: potassium transporter Kup [Acidovorax sp.]|jgi:KUP system potassium uptake protein|nr:potassium transporter Kup [Acidovorax sp.]
MQPSSSRSSLAALTLGAIGVVYGDIGTSVLYAVKEVFRSGHVAYTPANVYGVLSLLFWTLSVIVSLKYVVLVLRADNRGEGGLVAMLALAAEAVQDKPRLHGVLMAVGLFGACLFYGDGVITPAISVLSAVEGLEVVAPAMEHVVIPVTLAVLLFLFSMQKRGTASIGRWFGPITLLWFAVLAALGVGQIVHHPEILSALWPGHALRFVLGQPGTAFILLGAVVLCVTGAEALYADLGHFGKKPIRLAWFSAVMPALTLNYLGQGALLLDQPDAVRNPFFLMAPSWATLPLVVLATMATVIASQALISGAFSITKQVMQLGYLPRLTVLHTSTRDTGQIYMPFVNWALFIAIAMAVVMFRNSDNLAAAYGLAVTLDMLITTTLTFFVIRYLWRYPLWLCVLSTSCFFAVDILFFASNALKLAAGGWFPLLIAGSVYLLMRTWRRGRTLLSEQHRADAVDLPSFLEGLQHANVQRVDGTAVFITSEEGLVPPALLHNLKHNKVLHTQNLFVVLRHHEVPWIGLGQRAQVEALGSGCWQVVLHFGFKNDPNVPDALHQAELPGWKLDPMRTSYFLSREVIIPRMGGRMALWREKLFAQMHAGASGAAGFLHLPANAVVELGTKVHL